jgi:hypothetical protein
MDIAPTSVAQVRLRSSISVFFTIGEFDRGVQLSYRACLAVLSTQSGNPKFEV